MWRSCCILLLCSSLAVYADVTSDELSNVGPSIASERAAQSVAESAVAVESGPAMLQGPAPVGGGVRGCLPCPSDACWGQQVADPNEPWNAYTSATNLGYLVAEDYSAPNCSRICDIHWWGLSLLYDLGWYACDPTGMQFQIIFYGGPGPTNPVCTYSVTPTITPTAYTYSGFTLYYFSVPHLVPCCTQTTGWVSIQSVASPANCSFLWMNACPGQGNGNALQLQPDGTWLETGVDFGLCLTECQVSCQEGSSPEGEPACFDGYVDNFNGGCNSSPPIFWPITCGQTICGTSGTYLVGTAAIRDTDWYELNLAQPKTVTWKAVGEFPVRIAIVDGNAGCANPTILGLVDAAPCEPVSLTSACLPPGKYWLLVLPSVFTGVPCGSTYVAQVSCTPCNTGDPNLGHFSGWMAGGNLTPGVNNDGWTDPEFGGPWFQYPQWWNEWWPNEFDPSREKHVHLEFDVMTWNFGSVWVTINWSSPEWPPDMGRPPLPWEDQFVVRQEVGMYEVDGHYVVDLTIPFCPPWVSIDIWGERAWIEGTLRHECCTVNCQEGSIPEGEPPCYPQYVDNYNGGCASNPPVFQPINCSDVICGESGTYLFDGDPHRDTDWYQYFIAGPDPVAVTWKATAEFPLRLFIIDGSGGCTNPTILATASGPPCTPVSVTTPCLPAPHILWLWIGPDVFTGVPCGARYVAQLTCTPCWDLPPNLGVFSGWMDNGQMTAGNHNNGWTDPQYGGPWFEYPQWWNEWWLNEFDLSRIKNVVLDFDLMTWNDGWANVAINWSSPQWQNPERPPLPWEDAYVVRQPLGTFYVDGRYTFTATIPFCPRWVSLDVWGDNFWVEGTILHECQPGGCVGDLNCDGFINFGDINPFVLYLSNFASWQAAYPGCNPLNGDINGDGTYGQGSFGDINPFVALMSNGQGPCP